MTLDALGLPFFTLSSPGLGIPIQPFGVMVAIGVLIGAAVLRRYAARHGVEQGDVSGLITWLIVSGFVGMHVFDVLLYQRADLGRDPLLLLRFWDGISSWGGFVGGAIGYACFVWRRRLAWGLMADTAIVGVLLAFSIGRIGCSVVHDHIGGATDFALGIDYPRAFLASHGLLDEFAGHTGPVIRAHNLGLYELLYLVPVNALVLGLAFSRRRLPAGFLAVLAGALYAPVRFFLEYLRLGTSDPRYGGLTFAQWCSLAAFAVAIYVAIRLWRRGEPAPLAEATAPAAA
jgi:phosphatidylglycerol:prolipoprotein diacylglycerol transferase